MGTLGLDVIGILRVILSILGVGVTIGGLALRGIGNLKHALTKRTDELSDQLQRTHKELLDELKGDIVGLRDELRAEIIGVRDELKGELKGDTVSLRDRIDALHSEVIEMRVAMGDRVGRLEGRVFGVPLPDTGTD